MSSKKKKSAADVEQTAEMESGETAEKTSNRRSALMKGIRGLEGFRLWSQVEHPLILRTRITSLNRAMKCGGIPGNMLGVIHGPSQGGKSLLGAELLYDAWATGGWGLMVDAECRAVDLKWYHRICGNLEEIAYFRPLNYESAIDRIEKFRERFRASKNAGDLPATAMCVIVVDSVNRLAPRDELKELLDGKMEARGYPLRALITSRWLDRIVPTLTLDEVVIFITRESRKMDASPGQKTYRIKGGDAQVYDGGWILRCTAVQTVKREVEGAKIAIGMKHELEIIKNSMGPHLDEFANFYSSVGRQGEPLGLDFVREVREEALSRGIAKYKPGTGYIVGEETVAKEKVAFLKWLREENGGRANWEIIRDMLDESAAA